MKRDWIDKFTGWYMRNWHLALILILLVVVADCIFNRVQAGEPLYYHEAEAIAQDAAAQGLVPPDRTYELADHIYIHSQYYGDSEE